MPHMIEHAKSGRAACRSCKKKIEKGDLRLGEEIPNAFDPDGGTSHVWHHLACAAKKKPEALKQALATFSEPIPNREEIDKLLAEAKPEKAAFPYAEKAPTSRSKCLKCGETFEKDTLRVAIQREVDTGAFTAKSAGYLHPGCAKEYTGDLELLAKVKANSKLDAADATALEQALSL